MKTTHTEGPWQLTTVPFELMNNDNAASIYGPVSKQGGACLIADISRSAGDEEAIANAKLIAVAPELLKALQELLTLANDGYKANCDSGNHEEFLKEDRTLLMNARNAIQKAIG
jgi:hypothetical protein